jgi:hypothetical protein
VLHQESIDINLTDFFEGDVRNLMLKTTMNINTIAGSPATVSESLNRVEFEPF